MRKTQSLKSFLQCYAALSTLFSLYSRIMVQALQKLNTQYTIILGAEGELGRAMAREIARRGCNLILVSTSSCDLLRFAIGLQLNDEVQVEAVKLDLSDKDAIQEFIGMINTEYEIRALINNITCDWSMDWNKCIPEFSRESFLKRFQGAALITWGLLPHMVKLSSSYIQHIIPFPFGKEEFNADMEQSVGKMAAFARELDRELKHSTVSVSLMHPAPIKNLMQDLELINGYTQRDQVIAPGLIARKAVNGMLRGDRLIIPGFRNRVRYFMRRQIFWLRSAHPSLGSSLQPSV